MRDGRTRRSRESVSGSPAFSDFADRFSASLIVLTGALQGTDYAIDRPSTVLGRGPGVDIELDDETLSRQHASVEFAGGGLRLRDLGSLNGVRVNGAVVEQADLDHGDRLQLGNLTLQLVVESRQREPKVHYIADA